MIVGKGKDLTRSVNWKQKRNKETLFISGDQLLKIHIETINS